MSDPNPMQQSEAPKCPHCDAQPCKVAMTIASMGMNALIGVFFCGDCSMVLSVAPLPRVEIPEHGGDSPLIVRPS